jgi:hypothetical protein
MPQSTQLSEQDRTDSLGCSLVLVVSSESQGLTRVAEVFAETLRCSDRKGGEDHALGKNLGAMESDHG